VPVLIEGESETIWNRKPVKVTLNSNSEALDPASRLDISRIHTIGHDTPVAKLGRISPRDLERLRQYTGLFTRTQGLDDLEDENEEECEQ